MSSTKILTLIAGQNNVRETVRHAASAAPFMEKKMSEITIRCPECGTALAGAPSVLGQKVQCSECGETFIAEAELVPETVETSNKPPDDWVPDAFLQWKSIPSGRISERPDRISASVCGGKGKGIDSAGAKVKSMNLLSKPLVFGVIAVMVFIVALVAARGDKKTPGSKDRRDTIPRIDKGDNIVADAIRKAENAGTFSESFQILDAVIKKYPDSAHTQEAKALLERCRPVSSPEEAYSKVKFDDKAEKPQIRIRKKINRDNGFCLYLLPLEHKEAVEHLCDNMMPAVIKSYGICRDSRRDADRLEQEMKPLKRALNDSNYCYFAYTSKGITSVEVFNRVQEMGAEKRELVKVAIKSLEFVAKYLPQIELFLKADAAAAKVDIYSAGDLPAGLRNYSSDTCRYISSDSCDLSNIRGPVLLLAVEPMRVDAGTDSPLPGYQGWYLEYTPSFTPKDWVLE